MNINETLQTLLDDPTAEVSREWVEECRKAYPYFTVPTLLYLQRTQGLSADEREQLLQRLSIATPDRSVLRDHLAADEETFRNFYPPTDSAVDDKPSTGDAIDMFLDSFGHDTDKEAESIKQIIFNPVPDYADVLAMEDEKRRAAGGRSARYDSESDDSLIDRFVENSRRAEQSVPATLVPSEDISVAEKAEMAAANVPAHEETDDSMLSESLAKIYIRKHNYSKALEIISSISLNFPEKSIYFADQIRFLKKLVANEKLKNKK